jgi:ORF6N domain
MNTTPVLPLETITERIRLLRKQKVLLDADLAALYGVETRRLNEQVRRNRERFPEDFIFELTVTEFANLKSQIATSSWGGRRKLPLAFTEHGAIMAATVLSTPRAVEVSVYVVRAFVRLRELALTHDDLAKRLNDLEAKTDALATSHDSLSRQTQAQLKQVFDALRALMTPPDPPKRPIGFVTPKDSGSKASSQRARAEFSAIERRSPSARGRRWRGANPVRVAPGRPGFAIGRGTPPGRFGRWAPVTRRRHGGLGSRFS